MRFMRNRNCSQHWLPSKALLPEEAVQALAPGDREVTFAFGGFNAVLFLGQRRDENRKVDLPFAQAALLVSLSIQ